MVDLKRGFHLQVERVKNKIIDAQISTSLKESPLCKRGTAEGPRHNLPCYENLLVASEILHLIPCLWID